MKYAILNKETQQVVNIVMVDDEKHLSFIMNENEYGVPASRSVEIGMIYDTSTNTFPDVFETDRILELKDKIINLYQTHRNSMQENFYMNSEQLQVHSEYLDRLNSSLSLETFDELKSEFDSIGAPPVFPPKPKEITQDIFRSILNLTEKILWDNPETGTEIQRSTINTLKLEFPYYGVDSMNEELALLEQIEFFTSDRVIEIKQILSE